MDYNDVTEFSWAILLISTNTKLHKGAGISNLESSELSAVVKVI